MSPGCIEDTSSGFAVSASIDIAHSYIFSQDVFSASNADLAQCYKPWKRCLVVIDENVLHHAATMIPDYFAAHDISIRVHPIRISEDMKNVNTLLEICEFFSTSDLVRREPVLVIGGGLVTDVVG